jgi:hypothetical protein
MSKFQIVSTNLEPALSGKSTILAGATLTNTGDAAGDYTEHQVHAPFFSFKRA